MCALHANSVTVMSNPLMSASTIDVFTDVELYKIRVMFECFRIRNTSKPAEMNLDYKLG